MDPQTPNRRWDLETLVELSRALLQKARDLFLGMNLTSTWARFILLIISLPLVYLGLLWLIGESPVLIGRFFDSVADGIEALFNDFASILRILRERPPAPPGPAVPPDIYAKLPRAPGTPFITSFGLLFKWITTDSIQMLIAFFALPLIWSFLRAINVFEDAFNTGSLRSAISYILLVNVPLVRPRYVVREGSLIQSGRLTRLQLIGGPARLTVLPDNLAVLENPRGQARIIGAEDSPQLVNGFERLHRIIPLQEHELTLSHQMRTRDGIPVELRNARFHYSIARGPHGKPPYTYDPEAVMALVYRHWAGKSWEDPQIRQQNALLLIRQELEQFVAGLEAYDLLPYLASAAQRAEFPIERNILQEFVVNFNNKRKEHGLQLTWQEDTVHPYGDWVLPPGLVEDHHSEAIRTSLQDRQLHERLNHIIPGEYAIDETHRLTNSILSHFESQRDKLSREELIRQLIVLYNHFLANQAQG